MEDLENALFLDQVRAVFKYSITDYVLLFKKAFIMTSMFLRFRQFGHREHIPHYWA